MDNIEYLNPVIDSDSIVYRMGFAVKADEPVENALYLTRNKVEDILARFPARGWYRMYLSGKTNFRTDIAKTRGYKAHRDPNNKPSYYKEIRNYLVSQYGALVVEGIEADDAVGIDQWKHKDKSTVIVSNDKDLDTIPGYHYNWVKDTLYYVSKNDADRNFFRQLLMGDGTDNVVGIPGCGIKTATHLINQGTCIMEWVEIAKREYAKAYAENGDDVLHEMADLLWIQREPNQRCPFL